MTNPTPLSTLLEELQVVRAEGVALSATLPDAPTTEAQRALAAKHGTPRQFARAVCNAIGEISVDEADRAIAAYCREWRAAG